MKDEKLTLTQEWDKTFPQSSNVTHSKITFHNRYGITLAADMYTDLYDRMDIIPFDKIETFFNTYLK